MVSDSQLENGFGDGVGSATLDHTVKRQHSDRENDLENGGDNSILHDKSRVEHIDGAKDIPSARTRIFEAPESIRNMTAEEREAAESRLRRKIDIRLMPMIILMYVVLRLPPVNRMDSIA